ncbi:MAG: hypothetical protein E7242_03695 [Lachnospiraceae bacterium]|nr:hypothetical protein [Lachnospiraceae bacterium]
MENYKIKYTSMYDFYGKAMSKTAQWLNSLEQIGASINQFTGMDSFKGQAADSMKQYFSEVHGTILTSLEYLINEYRSRLAMYVNGYRNIDSDIYSVLPRQSLKQVKKSMQWLYSYVEEKKNEAEKILDEVRDIVDIPGVSTYQLEVEIESVSNRITALDKAIIDYESQAMTSVNKLEEIIESALNMLSKMQQSGRDISGYQSGDILKNEEMLSLIARVQESFSFLKINSEVVKEAQENIEKVFEKYHEDYLAALDAKEKEAVSEICAAIASIVIGTMAVIFTAGAATPLVIPAVVAGTSSIAYGISNITEGAQDLYYANIGDLKTEAFNPIRDTLFGGNEKLYNMWGSLSQTTAAVVVPVGQLNKAISGASNLSTGDIISLAGKEMLRDVGLDTATGMITENIGQKLNLDGPEMLTFGLLGDVIINAGVGSVAKGIYNASEHVNDHVIKSAAIYVDQMFIDNNISRSSLEELTSPVIRDVIDKHGISLEHFSSLMNPNKELSVSEKALVSEVRQEIGLPQEGTMITKIIPEDEINNYLYLPYDYNEVRGYITSDEHSMYLIGFDKVYEGNRLDYDGTKFKIDKGIDGIAESIGSRDKVYGKINFVLQKEDVVTWTVTQDPNPNDPYTARGFTGSNNTVLPEQLIPKETPHMLMNGDVLTIHDADSGVILKRFIYDIDDGWIMVYGGNK